MSDTGVRTEKDARFPPHDWVETILGEVCEIKHGFAFKGEFITDQENENILLTPGNFEVGGGWKYGKKFYNGEVPENYVLKKHDLVVTMTDLSKDGDTLGYPALIPDNSNKKFLHNQRVGLVVIKKNIDKFFLHYLMRWRDYQKFIVNSATGSTVRHTSPAKISEFKFFLPPRPEQQAIASVLSAFDDKIELLREQNKTLEELGQVIFQEWFIANADIEKQRLGDLVEVKRGGSPRPIQDYISETGYRWLKISDASATASPFIFEIKECIKEEGLNKTTLLKAGSLVLSNSATPGIPKILAVDSCIHDGWLHFPKSRFSNEFLYLLFQEIRPQLIQQGSGSVFTNLKTDILKDYEAPLPSDEILQRFDDTIKPIFEKIYDNANQIQSLARSRDELLPRLMRGEVRVSESGF